MRAVDRKVIRDLWRMRVQFLAIALVVACGIGFYLGMRTTVRSLDAARAATYASERLAHVFAALKRAPEHAADRIRSIPGVHRVQTRVVMDVLLDVPGMDEAATGRLVSLPDRGVPEVNGLRLRSGRLPQRGHEVVVGEAFANAHATRLGDSLAAILNGRWQRLTIVGTALSPEFVYAVPPGSLLPDDRRFAVMWMRREHLAAALDLEGAFNDVALRVERDANVRRIIEALDRILGPYGGVGAIPRRDHVSAFFVENEIKQLDTFGTVVPIVFLMIAAFLLHVVLARIVASQRPQIAALKAMGYRNRELAGHYLKLTGSVLCVGSLLGCLLGAWIGSSMTRAYSDYYRFPDLAFRMDPGEVLPAVAIAVIAGLLGGAGAILRVVHRPPAESLRPAPPAVYRPTLAERMARLLPPSARMIFREIERRPLRAILTAAGISLAAALMVLCLFMYDAFDHVMQVQFGISQREDVRLELSEARSTGALSEIEKLPGVRHAEPFRQVPARLRVGHRHRNVGILGIRSDSALHVSLDTRLRTVPIPDNGLVLSRKLADILDVVPGDRVEIEVLEGRRARTEVRVARVVETWLGLSAEMELRALCALLQETPSANGAWLLADEEQLVDLHRAIKRMPTAAGISSRRQTLRLYREIVDENIGTSVGVSVVLATVLALGVLYNAARITLAERARDLCTLQVLGLRRGEVARILLGELAILTALAIPVGLWLGRHLAALLVSSPGFDTEQFRIPLLISPATYAFSALAVLLSASVSAWSAWRQLDRTDIVDVLKTGD